LLGLRDIKGVIVKQNAKIIDVIVEQLKSYVIQNAIVVYLVKINKIYLDNNNNHDYVDSNYINK